MQAGWPCIRPSTHPHAHVDDIRHVEVRRRCCRPAAAAAAALAALGGSRSRGSLPRLRLLLPQQPPGHDQLLHDLAWREVAAEPHAPGEAELAVHGAADLGRRAARGDRLSCWGRASLLLSCRLLLPGERARELAGPGRAQQQR